LYNAYARRSRPVSLADQNLDLALSANANRSSLGKASAYEAALEAEIPDGMLNNLSLSFSAAVERSLAWGTHRYYGLLASKAWYNKDADAGFEAGYSRQWDEGWKRINDNAWTKASRDMQLAGGDRIQAAFEVSAAKRESGWPQADFTFSPALKYAFSMPSGLRAQAGVWHALDIHSESAWDETAWPEAPEQGKTRRMDNRTGLDFKLWKDLPHGYFLSLESSLEFWWTNTAGTGPASSRPGQGRLAFAVGRSSI
jgi:hypothetical protein